MVRHQVQVHLADLVDRADQILFLVPRQVAHVDHTKAAVGDQQSHRLRIFGGIGVVHLECGAVRSRLPRSGQRRVDHLAGRRDHLDIDSLDRDGVARLHLDVIPLGTECRVFVEEHPRRLAVFHAGTVVHEVADRQFPG